MQSIQGLLQLLQEGAPLLLKLIVLLGAVSALCTALSGLLNAAVAAFPSLKGGAVDHAAQLCEVAGVDVGKAIDVLKSLAAKFGIGAAPAAKALAVGLAAAALLHAGTARAAITFGNDELVLSYGPSVPVVQVNLKDHAQTSVAQGAGVMASLELPKLSFSLLGKSWAPVSLDAIAYGSLVNGAAGAQYGQLLVGGMVAFMNSIVGVGWAHSLFSPGGDGVLMFALSFNIELAPSSPPAGVAQGALGLPRGNTLSLGAL